MIEVKNLCKNINNSEILKNINFKMNDGEFVAIMGPSGSGKSTFLYCVSGMDSINDGEVFFNGYNFRNLSEKEISKVRLECMGFVFQRMNFLKNLSIEDNIVFPALQLGKLKNKDIYKIADDIMDKMDIKSISNKDIREVSGGQLQRAGICRAIINQPKILFADEPTGALNSKLSGEVMEIISDIHKKGTSILLVTHDIKVSAKSNRVIFIKDGYINNELNFSENETYDERIKKIIDIMDKTGI